MVGAITELAQECGIGITKARELMASGEVQSVKIGKLRKVRHDALVSYLDSLSVSP